ncbi:hypothetical protein O181_121888 [Austropuccinia psidii MF-1]|uniref:Uncharacterized protein n=1 Tax=Austropuccinia psidii MF-1 TaxID=1389203 RepID=A0A9Q3KIR4_9BASI|nr:hypothetical protein [Austropuccinia psidii MF-1]
MYVQHSPPSTQNVSQARAQAVHTPTPRLPLDGTPEVPELRAHLEQRTSNERGSIIQEGRGPRRSSSFSGVVGAFPGISRTTLKGPCYDYAEEEESSMEEEESESNKAAPTYVGNLKVLEGQL